MITNLLDHGAASGFLLLLVATAPCVAFFLSMRPKLYPGFPTAGIDSKNMTWSKIEHARKQWASDAPSIIAKGLQQFAGCFQVVTSSGPKIILPGKYVDEIRNDDRMKFSEAIHQELFGAYPGFEVFSASKQNGVVVEMVRGKLTQSLNFITPDLASETSAALKKICGEPKEFQECEYKSVLLQLVARVSSRVFVGPELCANQDWLDLSVNYTVHAMQAVHALGQWPFLLRPFVHWFLPEVRTIKGEVARARQILEPVIQKRREANEVAKANGEKTSKVADTIGWLDDMFKGERHDAALMQLGLSFAAIHTTSELVSGIMADLCNNPEWFGPLREEMVASIKEHGWSKKALQAMTLTDSLMKESQRHHFIDVAAMRRVASEPIKLSDGTRIPKGALTMVSLDKMKDKETFGDRSGYMPRRFLELRQKPGNENKWQFVTTGPEHLAFGHGKHSCPGRFFASNEIKVILIHLVVKYEWQWTASGHKKDIYNGISVSTDPKSKAMFRMRDAEIEL